MGSILTVSNGTWSPTPSRYSYQWLRDGKAIKGATSSKYKLTKSDAGKKISVTVTAKRSAYASASKTAKAVRPKR